MRRITQRDEILAKLELIEVQARTMLMLAKEIRRLLAAEANPEDTLDRPAGPRLGKKAA